LGKVGIFGGSFDPIHFGHLITAQVLLEKRKLSKIIFVPAFISPHKLQYEYSAPEHRYNMVNLAISSYPYFDISDYEIKRNDISYTFNTLAEFYKKYDSMELIIGFDNLISFDTWHRHDDVLELADLVVLKRTYDKEVKHTHKYFENAIFIDSPTIEISSTEIRKRVNKNLPIDYYLPISVKNYIMENKLYRRF
jgi:nicotinate-nucleotide adenylyltransferase